MLLLRLIFLVGPLLAVTFNTKSKESKKPELDEVFTKSINDFNDDIQRLEDEYNQKEKAYKDVSNNAKRGRKIQARNERDNAMERLEAAKKRKEGMNHFEIYFIKQNMYLHYIVNVLFRFSNNEQIQ